MLSKCEHCGREYESKTALSRYCSPKCYKAAWYVKNQKPQAKLVKCQVCGKEFMSWAGKKYCSTICRRRSYYSKPKLKKCIICGKEFEDKRGRNCCSAECLDIARHRDKTPRVLKYDLVCRICGKEFKASTPHKFYCSAKCANVATVRRAMAARQQPVQVIKTCPVCGKEFVAKQSRSRFCSDSCRNSFHNKAHQLERQQTWARKEVNRIETAERRRLTIEERLTKLQQEKRLKLLADNEKVRAQIRAFVESRVKQ